MIALLAQAADTPSNGLSPTDNVPYVWVALIVAALASAVVVLYRSVRESDAKHMDVAREYAADTKAQALDAQAARTELLHRMDSVATKLDALGEKIEECGRRT